MKLLTINSSGCGDPSNIAFYWLPRGYIHMAWIPPSSPSACSTERVAAIGEEPWAGSRWETLSTEALVKCVSISCTKTEASYCCVVEPGFGSAGQARVIFFQQVIFVKFTILLFFQKCRTFSICLWTRVEQKSRKISISNCFPLIIMFDNC